MGKYSLRQLCQLRYNNWNVDLPCYWLWQFTFSIYHEAYTGSPSWNFYQNGTHVALVEQASNGVHYITSLGSFITSAKASDTFQWQFQYINDSSPPGELPW